LPLNLQYHPFTTCLDFLTRWVFGLLLQINKNIVFFIHTIYEDKKIIYTFLFIVKFDKSSHVNSIIFFVCPFMLEVSHRVDQSVWCGT